MAFVQYDKETLEILYTIDKEEEGAIEIPNEYLVSSNVLDCLKEFKIQKAKEHMDELYRRYLKKYPEVERQSFKDKAREAALVMKNKASNIDTPLEDTPYLSALTANDVTARDALAEAIDAKIKEYAALEAQGYALRDTIKNATKVNELLDILL